MALAPGVSPAVICSQAQECWKSSASLVAFGRFPQRVVAVGLCSVFLPPRITSTEAEVKSRRRRLCIVRANAPPPPLIHIDQPLVGHPAPNFEAEAVQNQEFIKVKLSSYAGKKFVVLFFYPLNFTFVCPSELTAFSDRYSEFQKHDCEVLAVSTDSVFSHLAWIQTDRKSGGLGDIKYPLVSDLTKAITKAYRLLLPEQGIGLRGLFIIDKEGLIQHSSVNSLAVGRNVDEALRLLQAVQYVKAHPEEVCLANWQPGDDGVRSSIPL